MYAMTAAHKSLPLPTYVRVKNLRNNKSIVVRVNDRGPFVHNRIIDLSYSAARKLDMIGTGTSLVEVTAISFDQPPKRQTRASAKEAQAVTTAPADKAPKAGKPAQSTTPAPKESTVYVQVGAFGDASDTSDAGDASSRPLREFVDDPVQ